MSASRHLATTLLLMVAMLPLAATQAQESGYQLNAGDVLQISVWREPELMRDVLIRPDGMLSFPLVGVLPAAGTTPEDVQAALVEALAQFIPEPVVTVSVLGTNGNRIYVLGKVARPGEYVMSKQLDVMQALALAGGLSSFASENKIRILRRDSSGRQQAISFRYSAVSGGDDLETNIGLMSGDVVVVP